MSKLNKLELFKDMFVLFTQIFMIGFYLYLFIEVDFFTAVKMYSTNVFENILTFFSNTIFICLPAYVYLFLGRLIDKYIYYAQVKLFDIRRDLHLYLFITFAYILTGIIKQFILYS